MAGHSIWTGAINFGLVTIPVKLMTAVREHTLHFHFLHGKDSGRVNNVRRCSECGKEVKWDEIQRGYEYEKGKFVVLSDADFKRVDVEATQSVDILEFVEEVEVDTMLYDQPYYLVPEKKGSHAYALLREALRESKRVGVAKVVIRSKEHMALVRVDGAALVLELMHFADEIVNPKSLEIPAVKSEAPRAGEMKAAMMLIDAMKAKFDAKEFHDRYTDELLAMIEARAKGSAAPVAAKKAKPASNVVDLVSMLQQSLDHTAKHRGVSGSASNTNAKAPAKTAGKAASKTAKRAASAPVAKRKKSA